MAEGNTPVEQIVSGWLASPDHLENIQTAAYTTVGTGVFTGEDGLTRYVQVFGGDPVAVAEEIAAREAAAAPAAPAEDATAPAEDATAPAEDATAPAPAYDAPAAGN
jgi:hypothetical protein